MFLGHNKSMQIEMDSDDEVFGEIQKLMKRNEPVNLALLNFHPARLFKILIPLSLLRSLPRNNSTENAANRVVVARAIHHGLILYDIIC